MGDLAMRWSQLGHRDIVNVHDGSRLGRAGDADLVFDPGTGAIAGFVVYSPGWLGSWLGALVGLRRQMTVPWSAVRRLGPEVLVVEFNPARQPRRDAGPERW